MTHDQYKTGEAGSNSNDTIADDYSVTKNEVLEVLNENDGNPLALIKHNKLRYALAEAKHNAIEYDFLYDEVDGEINWNSSSTMKKERYETMLDKLWEEMNDDEGNGDAIPVHELSPSEFQNEVDLENMIDREMAHGVYEWIHHNMNVTAIFGEDESGDVLQYDDGIWTDNSAQGVKRKAIELLGPKSSTGVSTELLENHLKNRHPTNVDPDVLGLDGGEIAVKNGVLNLDEGEIVRDLSPEDYAITQVPWKYIPDATCPEWEEFISQSVGNDKQDLIQEYVGYCLLRGEYPWAKALMLLGDGRNGKTTFLNAIQELLGREENVMNADLSELAGGRFSAYRLEGKLANINADIEDDEITETSMFKNMTGGDAYQVEQKYGDPYDHKNSAKLIFAANHIPEVDTEEHAFYRRWLLVRFPHTFTNRKDDGNPDADPDLEAKLSSEMEGILTWAVEGYQRLVENDGQFTNSLSAEQVRKQWYSYANPMAKFCRDYLVYDENERFTPTSKIYKRYEQFMQDQPTSPADQKQLTSYIKKKYDHQGDYGVKTDDGEQSRAFGYVHIRHNKL